MAAAAAWSLWELFAPLVPGSGTSAGGDWPTHNCIYSKIDFTKQEKVNFLISLTSRIDFHFIERNSKRRAGCRPTMQNSAQLKPKRTEAHRQWHRYRLGISRATGPNALPPSGIFGCNRTRPLFLAVTGLRRQVLPLRRDSSPVSRIIPAPRPIL